MMERVALELQKRAISLKKDPDDFDLFGRSSFNRYYYALFLRVRPLILEFNHNWSEGHADIPNILKTTLPKEIKAFRNKMAKQQSANTVQICNRAITSAAELSNLMNSARAVRTSADYYPEVRIISDGNDRFSLNNVSINDAHQWVDKVDRYVGEITRALRLSRGTV